MCTDYYRGGGRLFWVILKYRSTGCLLLLIIELVPCLYKDKTLSCHALPSCLEVLSPHFLKKKSKYANMSSWRASTMTCHQHNQVNANVLGMLSSTSPRQSVGMRNRESHIWKEWWDEGQWNIDTQGTGHDSQSLLQRHQDPGVGNRE